ncbi:hypothetical protein KC19_9G098300 [Ceratodon purpureus]|uniref:Uncharacterized protein n=1 Tax=Ceratodon purpureus TaxID=3225 RepID=A0A8T0GU26_CERPU|nr:hypothetical protein KC19_9G098300 [Ceratodon purpureus]
MIKPSRLPCEVALQIGAKADVTQINGVLKELCVKLQCSTQVDHDRNGET